MPKIIDYSDKTPKIIAMYKQGKTLHEIAAVFHVAHSTIWSHLKKNGISSHPVGRRKKDDELLVFASCIHAAMVGRVGPEVANQIWIDLHENIEFEEQYIVSDGRCAADQIKCPDCGTTNGEHDLNCDLVRCPRCGGQRLTCGCSEVKQNNGGN